MRFDENLLFSQALRNRLDTEAAMEADLGTTSASWYAVKMLDDHQVVIERNYDPRAGIISDPPTHQMLWAEAVSKILNHECGHDGRWVVGFTHPPGYGEMVLCEPKFSWRRIIKVWLDIDGDPQFTVDCIENWENVASQSPHHFIGQAEEAWKHWKVLMRDVLQPKDYQLKQLAKGGSA